VPDDRTFCSFFFPIHFARASAAGKLHEISLFDDLLKRDLALIYTELKTTCVLLFDECNVLRGSRALLEKLRNGFMSMQGFMLVFAGTPELFPFLDDVFSPISRQFKRIAVKAFQSPGDTLDCVIKPLWSLPLDGSVDDVFELGRPNQIIEIHQLTNGRPHEIQLVCHAMFRRLQEGRSGRMTLDRAVLEDIRKDLVRIQGDGQRVLVEKLQELTEEDLLALGMLCGTGSRLPVEAAGALEFLFHGYERCTLEQLRSSAENLRERGFIEIKEEGSVEFVGDEFDFIYFKYLAKDRGVKFVVRRSIPMKYCMAFEMAACVSGIEGAFCSPEENLGGRMESVDEVVDLVRRLGDQHDTGDVFKEFEREMHQLFAIFFRRPRVVGIVLWAVRVEASWWSGG